MDHDRGRATVFNDLTAGADVETSLARAVHVFDAVDAVDLGTRWEIRPLHALHVLLDADERTPIGVDLAGQHALHVQVNGGGHLGQVMRRDARGHADRDAV